MRVARRNASARGAAVALDMVRRAPTTAEALFSSAAYSAWVNDPAYADRLGEWKSRGSDTAFAAMLTFTRASTADDLDAYGATQTHAVNGARLGFDGSGNPLGLLLENASAPRAVDVALIGGAAFLSAFAGDRTGWIVAECMLPAVAIATSQWILQVDDGADTNALSARNPASSSNLQMFLASTNVGSAGGAITAGVTFRLGMRWTTARADLFAHGALVGGGNVTVPAAAFTTLRLMNRPAGDRSANGRMRGLWCGPEQPSNTQMQALTVVGADVAAVLGA